MTLLGPAACICRGGDDRVGRVSGSSGGCLLSGCRGSARLRRDEGGGRRHRGSHSKGGARGHRGCAGGGILPGLAGASTAPVHLPPGIQIAVRQTSHGQVSLASAQVLLHVQSASLLSVQGCRGSGRLRLRSSDFAAQGIGNSKLLAHLLLGMENQVHLLLQSLLAGAAATADSEEGGFHTAEAGEQAGHLQLLFCRLAASQHKLSGAQLKQGLRTQIRGIIIIKGCNNGSSS